jgi:uncharacterized protein YlxW (UPF0749 family)
MGSTSAPDSSIMAESTTTGTMGTSSYGVGSGVAATAAAPGSRQRGGKGAMRRQELARQLREMEQTVAELSAQREAETAAAAHSREEDEATDQLRRQVETLQLEVERLRAEQEQVRLSDLEPPPAYDHPPEEQTRQESNTS